MTMVIMLRMTMMMKQDSRMSDEECGVARDVTYP